MECFGRKWGTENIIESNRQYEVREMKFIGSGQTPMQFYRRREETIICTSGFFWVDSIINGLMFTRVLKIGDCYHLPAQTVFRVRAMGQEGTILCICSPGDEKPVDVSDHWKSS